MATVSAPSFGAQPAESATNARLARRDAYITIALGFWLMIGLFVDGWAHNNLTQLETFFTPWHALFYSGYGANALWMGWLMRHPRGAAIGRFGMPRGYDLGMAGIFIFGVGGIGDMVWHLIFGIERDIAALLSPTHLLLIVGLILIVSSPFRAAWLSDDAAGDAPTLRAFLPALLSLTMVAAFIIFINMYLWAPSAVHHNARFITYWNQAQWGDAGQVASDYAMQENLAAILISNAFLIAPVLLLLRRWQLPFGSVTILWTLVTLLMGAMFETLWRRPMLVGVVVVAALIADVLIRRLHPWASRPNAFRLFAFVAPVVLWALHFAAVALFQGGEGWSTELWAGITVMAGLTSLGLSILVLPPALPAHLQPSAHS